MLLRKIDKFLVSWKKRMHSPLIIKGARQIGKTTSIENFGKNYKSFIEINFIEEPSFKDIFSNGFDVNSIIKAISLKKPNSKFIDNNTLILFDEIQAYPDATTSLKFFKQDGRFDVICSGSLLGVNYNKISSVAVGYKEDYVMNSLDFEEFLWAIGYTEKQIQELFENMRNLKAFSELVMKTFNNLFEDYIYCGGMPAIVNQFIKDKHFSNVFQMQKQLSIDYEDDITKYVDGLDVARVKNIYKHITSQLSKDNHKFQITKLSHGARSRYYEGCQERLKEAGIINIAYNLSSLNKPLVGYEDYSNYRIYYFDTSLLVANLDEGAKFNFLSNKNFNIYNGAVYEDVICESLVKQGIEVYFNRSSDSTVELDFVIEHKDFIVPIEVKKEKGRTKSLKSLIENKTIKYGIKFSKNNIGFDGNILTFPYFVSFMLKQFLENTDYIK